MHAGTFVQCRTGIYLLLVVVPFFALYSYGQQFNTAQLKEQEKLVDEFQKIKYAQIDSLKKKIQSADDNMKVNCLNQLYYAELQVNSNASFNYLIQAGSLAQKIGYRKGYAMSLENMGHYYMETKNLPIAEKYLREATEEYRLNHFKEEYYTSLHQLGLLMFWQMKFVEAAKLHNLVYNYRKNFPNDPQIAYTYRNLAKILEAQGYYEQAFEYYRKDMKISRRMKDDKGSRKSYGISSHLYLGNMYMQAGDKKNATRYFRETGERALNNVMPDVYDRQQGQINFVLENYDSARYYFLLEQYCISRWVKDSTVHDMAMRFSDISIGQTYVMQDRYDTAISLLKRSLSLYNGSIFANDIYFYLAKAYFGLNQYRQSLEYSRELMRISNESGARPLKRDAAEMHYKIFDRLGNTDSAYKYLQMFVSISDSLSAEKQLRNIALMEWQAADEQNKSAILLLNKEKIINNKQKQVLLIGLAAFILAGVFGFRYFTLRHKHDKIKQTQLEMQALRSQMNPHFIFNSLNSINNFILRHDSVSASRYLTKFSRLIRMMLQHSQFPLIPLQDELDALKIYIELEQLRFDNRFEYTIHVPPDLDITTFTVPPLIFQPFVENAIWHGLMQKQEKGHLNINLYVRNNSVYCEIDDDGIGRRQSELNGKALDSVHTSTGIKITTSRISRLDKNSQASVPVKIKDNIHPDGTALGTTVIIKLPGNYD